MITPDIHPVELKVFLNHVYEFKKGVRQMILYTTNRKYEDFAVKWLSNQKINYLIQPVGLIKSIFFGREECINAIRYLVNRPLNQLSPEEDFIFLAMIYARSVNDTATARYVDVLFCFGFHFLFGLPRTCLSLPEALLFILPKLISVYHSIAYKYQKCL